MNTPIYHNLPTERIYQNLSSGPRAIRRTDSSLKRRIARKHSFPGPSSSRSSESERDASGAAAVSELLRQINFPSLSRTRQPPPPSLQRRCSENWSSREFQHHNENDLCRIDPHKLEAVLRFMEAHHIDPFLPPRRALDYPPRGLRRIQSERNLGDATGISGSRWSSMERLQHPREKKRKRSVSLFFGGRNDDFEYGPGIVEKLKAKFSRLGLTRDTRSRRSPSADELNNHDYEPIRHTEAPLLVRRHSKSTNDIHAPEEQRTYTIHRVVRVDPEEEPVDVPCISTLRRRFETSEPRFSRARPVSADFSQCRSDFSISHHSTSLAYDTPPPRSMRLVEAAVQEDYYNTAPIGSPPPPVVRSPPPQVLVQAPLPATITPSPPTSRVVPIEQPTRRLRVLEVLNRSEEEPEFIKIGRKLRKSAAPPPDLYETVENHNQQHEISRENEVVERTHETVHCHRNFYQDEHYEFPMEQSTIHEPPTYVDRTPVVSAMIETSRAPPPRKFVFRGEAQLPTLSGNIRVIRDSSSLSFELPPDPEPVSSMTSSGVLPPPIHTTAATPPTVPTIATQPQGSPPPEEPRPSRMPRPSPIEPLTSIVMESVPSPPCVLCENSQPLVAPTDAKNDGEGGISEVQRLLSRFQMNRTSRGVFEIPQEDPSRVFTGTVVGVRGNDVFAEAPRPATVTGRVNVVSISVRSDAPSVITTSLNSSDGVSPISTPTPSKRPAPSPPEEVVVVEQKVEPARLAEAPPPISQIDEPRKSLSSQYLEEKAKRERPYGDDVTELRTELRESSVDEDPVEDTQPEVVQTSTSEIQDSSSDSESDDLFSSSTPPTRPFSLSFVEPMIAGDGNPVRHTLLSLVMEEDVPMLLEAMTEKYNFVFEDLIDNPSTSSIIYPQETRKQRRQQRQVSSIKFQEEAPRVYTYLDEISAQGSQWVEGTLLDYDTYQQMLEAEQEELDQNLIELNRWKQAVVRSHWEETQDSVMHGSNGFSSIPDPNTISV